MATIHTVARSCRASTSRVVLPARHILPALQSRSLSAIPQQHFSNVPFFVPPFGLGSIKNSSEYPGVRGQGRHSPGGGKGIDPEEEVDDREWELRVARGMLHLRETLPQFFNHDMTSADMLPPDIFSRHVVLKLPAPLPLKVSSLSAYSVAFSLTRSGMQALHTNLRSEMERMTFSPTPSDAAKDNPKASLILSQKKFPAHRQKQIRVLVSVWGTLRLPPHHETKWHTSSLYTFSPVSGLIESHEVETIRPLPGEGVGEWLMSHLLGWTSRQGGHEGAVPCPRTAVLPQDPRLVRFKKEQRGEGDV
ncbi:hypothetical protein IAT38_000827 [Cryptococcus sp. DSM 104549]